MASRSTAATELGFCIAVQKCSYGKCRKNGTHHLQIQTSSATPSGEDASETIDAWYCERHYEKLIKTNQ